MINIQLGSSERLFIAVLVFSAFLLLYTFGKEFIKERFEHQKTWEGNVVLKDATNSKTEKED